MNDKHKWMGFFGALTGLLLAGTLGFAQQTPTLSLSGSKSSGDPTLSLPGPDSGSGNASVGGREAPSGSSPIDCSTILENLASSAGTALSGLSGLQQDQASYKQAKARVSQARAAYGAAYAQCLQEGPGGKDCAVANAEEQKVHQAESEEAAAKARLKSDNNMAGNKTGRLSQSAAAFNYCLNPGGTLGGGGGQQGYGSYGAGGQSGNSSQDQQQQADQARQQYLAETAYNAALGKAMAGQGSQNSVSLGKGGYLNVYTVNGKPDFSSITIFYRGSQSNPDLTTSYTTWSQMSDQQRQQIEGFLKYTAVEPTSGPPIPLNQLNSLAASILGDGQGVTALPPYPYPGASGGQSNSAPAIVGVNAACGNSGQGSSVNLYGGTPLPDRGGPIGQGDSNSASNSSPNYILPNGLPVITVGAPGSWVPIGGGMEKWVPQNPDDPLNSVYKSGTMISLGSGNDAWVPANGGAPPQGLVSNLGGAIQPSQLPALMQMYATGAVPGSN
ncbi:MAG: hypothetical protein KGI84_06990 [Elusimicrobia bacterium]|nr:hypothetical protein [Elusimicrobiota bacterium]